MKKYYMRLDDAAEKANHSNWGRMEALLDFYDICPIVGVIPHCQDEKMNQFPTDGFFWDHVREWYNKGWIIAMHGYNHVYSSCKSGINPVNNKSEFAGLSLMEQQIKIREGYSIMLSQGIIPDIFFAPSHTFDENTLLALKKESFIRVISDTIAYDAYKQGDFVFIPQQTGMARNLPFKIVTMCYHPNNMTHKDFEILELFLKKHKNEFFGQRDFEYHKRTLRKNSILDKILKRIYFLGRR